VIHRTLRAGGDVRDDGDTHEVGDRTAEGDPTAAGGVGDDGDATAEGRATVDDPAVTPPEGPPVIRARFRLHLPAGLWITEVSSAHPGATFRLLTAVPTGERSLALGEVVGEEVRAAADGLREHPSVVAYESLHVGDDRALGRYETTERALFDFLGDGSVLPEFPLVVEDGVMTFDVTATREQFDAFGTTLEASGLAYDLLSLVHEDDREDALTDRQRECLHTAVRMGYFEVPREAKLSAVAAELGVDESTASETIRRGTARLLDRYVLER
jgi:predicted DNA binding protein